MDTNTYVGKIKRTRKRWRKYSRQLRKVGKNPEYVTARYQVFWYTSDAYHEINIGPVYVGVDLANGKDVTVSSVYHAPTNPHTP